MRRRKGGREGGRKEGEGSGKRENRTPCDTKKGGREGKREGGWEGRRERPASTHLPPCRYHKGNCSAGSNVMAPQAHIHYTVPDLRREEEKEGGNEGGREGGGEGKIESRPHKRGKCHPSLLYVCT